MTEEPEEIFHCCPCYGRERQWSFAGGCCIIWIPGWNVEIVELLVREILGVPGKAHCAVGSLGALVEKGQSASQCVLELIALCSKESGIS